MYKIEELENGLENIDGIFCNAISVGMRESEDLAFIRSENELNISAVFTKNRFKASPLNHFLKYPKDFKTNFLLINAKNANAMTGEQGIKDIDTIFNELSKKISLINPIMSSTGVIGYRLPIEKIVNGFDKLDFNSKNSEITAKAIMTTDSFKKELAYRVKFEDKEFNIAGICKGAGMINPTMATMLCFIVTDANIPKKEINELLIEATNNSFNKISVDGDTSTNDTVMLLSNPKKEYHKEAFKEALNKILFEFAMMILRDGEGSNKVVSFEVKNAKTKEDAIKASKALSNSLLVKTALFGEDPNWGRIASTIGASQIECDEEKLKIYYDDLIIYSNEFRELTKEREDKAYKIMKQDSFKVICDLGVGDKSYISYGCDLSYEYVKINAEYRT